MPRGDYFELRLVERDVLSVDEDVDELAPRRGPPSCDHAHPSQEGRLRKARDEVLLDDDEVAPSEAILADRTRPTSQRRSQAAAPARAR